MSEINMPDHESAVGTLALVMLDRLFDLDITVTPGEELLSLPTADALLVVLSMAEVRKLTDDVREQLARQILKAVDHRRQRKLRDVLDRGYGLKDERF